VITLFAIPKPFDPPRTAMIQRNAIESWTLLQPKCEILLFGAERGTREAARRFGAIHVPELAFSEHGAPLLDDLFRRAREVATRPLLAYVNADVLLLADFMDAVERVADRPSAFLLAGGRWELELTRPIDFSGAWEEAMRRRLRKRGRRGSAWLLDYFVFRRDLWGEIPPFAIGRQRWDNWLIHEALRLGAEVVDGTKAITAVHQNHDWSHIRGSERSQWHRPRAKWSSPDRDRNLMLAGDRIRNLTDATHVLKAEGVARRAPRSRLYGKLRLKLAAVSRFANPMRQ